MNWNRFFVIVFFASMPVLSSAQPGDPGGGGKPGDVPITGIEYLVGGGLLLGFRYFAKRKGNKC